MYNAGAKAPRRQGTKSTYGFNPSHKMANILTSLTIVHESCALYCRILVFMNKSGNDSRITNSEYREVIKQSTTAMGDAPVVMALEVPLAYFITQGVSPRRAVD